MRSRRQADVKNQEIQRHQRRPEGVAEIPHAHAGDVQDAGRNSGAGDGCAEIRLQDDQPQKHQHRRGRRQQRVAHVIDGLGAALQKIGEKQNQHRLGQFRGLERKPAGVNPAMRVVRAVEKENRNQQQRGEPHQRKHQRGMLVAAVVHAHGHHHGHESGHRPDQLLRQERIRRTEPLPRHHRRRREHHHQPTNTSSMVTVNSQRSTLTRFAMGHSFHHGGRRRGEELLIVEF